MSVKKLLPKDAAWMENKTEMALRKLFYLVQKRKRFLIRSGDINSYFFFISISGVSVGVGRGGGEERLDTNQFYPSFTKEGQIPWWIYSPLLCRFSESDCTWGSKHDWIRSIQASIVQWIRVPDTILKGCLSSRTLSFVDLSLSITVTKSHKKKRSSKQKNWDS